MKSKAIYRAFSDWRVNLYTSVKPRHSVRFFRRSRNHALLWNFMMRGYYDDNPPSLEECKRITAWSGPTTRKLLAEAEAKGFLTMKSAADDQRKRLVIPTELTIREYEAMMGGYMKLWKTLQEKA